MSAWETTVQDWLSGSVFDGWRGSNTSEEASLSPTCGDSTDLQLTLVTTPPPLK